MLETVRGAVRRVSKILNYAFQCDSYYYRYVYHESYSSGGRGKNFDVGHFTQTVQPVLFILAMLTGTIDFHHFILLSLIMSLPGGHKVSTQQRFFALFSLMLFIQSG